MLPPGSTIGILGGGQLGRMLVLAAAPLGLKCHVFCPEADAPAFDVCGLRTVAGYDDEAALAAFASAVDVVTTEFENVPARTAEVLAARVPVRPPPRALAVAQDRLLEKSFIHGLGIPVADFAEVGSAEMLTANSAAIGFPQILKTRRLGYDGKGQVRIARADDVAAAWDALGRAPAIIEAVVPFACEVSVILARGSDGVVQAFDITENVHRAGILRTSRVPASVTPDVTEAALAAASKIAVALDYVGVLAVEFFVTAEGDVLVNEIAPRVHNSGHWTIDACGCSQFEAQIRAAAGWPIPVLARHSDAVMENLIGDDVLRVPVLAAEDGARLHLYGKREARAGRKMGHVTRLMVRQ